MFRKILVPVDGSAFAAQALATASTIAARSGASIELLLVDTRAGRTPAELHGDATERVYISGLAQEAARLLGVPVTGLVLQGDPIETIVERARDTIADLIVMTTHGRTGFSRTIMGSIADGVVRESGVPVLLQRPTEGRTWRAAVSGGFHRILVPLDGTDDARMVVAPVLDLCRWMEAKPLLSRVVFPVMQMQFADVGLATYGLVDQEATTATVEQAQDAMIDLALDIEANTRIPVETSVDVGNDVADTLLRVAARSQADLIAMATHARGPSRLLASSIADRLMRMSNLPILLLHPRHDEPVVTIGVDTAATWEPADAIC